MKLAERTKILKVEPIAGADRIELATVQGWQSVIKKAEYAAGDTVIFIPIDTLIQPAEWNKFLWNREDPSKPIRLKTAKLRGVISQGLIVSASLVDDSIEDIAAALGVSKYEKPVPAHLAGQVAGDFPTHLVSKTDEDNLKSNPEVLNELKECEEIVISVKVDGCLDALTQIDTESGKMTIQEIVDTKCIGLSVLTLDVETKKTEYQPILNIFANENNNQKEWYELELEDGTILKLTENHKIFLPELNCYRETKNLKVGDTVIFK